MPSTPSSIALNIYRDVIPFGRQRRATRATTTELSCSSNPTRVVSHLPVATLVALLTGVVRAARSLSSQSTLLCLRCCETRKAHICRTTTVVRSSAEEPLTAANCQLPLSAVVQTRLRVYTRTRGSCSLTIISSVEGD